jgi:hypothetical protein
LDSKPTKSVGHFEENKFSVGGHQFLLECCPKLIKTYNFGQNAANKRQMKNKNEQYCAVRLFISKLARLFVNFLSAIVGIFYRVVRKDLISKVTLPSNTIADKSTLNIFNPISNLNSIKTRISVILLYWFSKNSFTYESFL